jgi:hypothetical protein
MEKNYAFVVCVNGKPMKTFKWYCLSEQQMRLQACAMSAGARIFKKTAAVLVYELVDDVYELCWSCDWFNKWAIKDIEFPKEYIYENGTIK